MPRLKPDAPKTNALTLVIVALTALILSLAGTAVSVAQIDHSAEYDACMVLAARAPSDALASAQTWEEAGGGNPARHCAAIAQFNLRDYRGAAMRLDALALEIGTVDRPLAAGLNDQAGRAWLLAGDQIAALAAFGQAIALTPDDAELYIGRAYAHAGRQDYRSALDDLRRAETLAPDSAEIHLLKAAALRFQGDVSAALAEAERAALAAPGNPDILLERGNIKWLLQDQDGARRDWSQVVAVAPDSAAAQSARRNLAGPE